VLEKTNKGEGCFEWRSLRSTGMNRSDTIRAHGDARQARMTGFMPAQPSFLLAPVFPGRHPATHNPAKTRLPLSRQSRGLETTSLRVRLPLSGIRPTFQGKNAKPLSGCGCKNFGWWPVLISGLSYLTVCLSTVSKLSWWSRFAHQPAHAPTSRKAICRT